jgi:hypothetical protein
MSSLKFKKPQAVFVCRISSIRDRASLFLNFKSEFWNGIEKPLRVFWFVDLGCLWLSFTYPIWLPKKKIYARWLQHVGNGGYYCRAAIPAKFVRKHNLRRFNLAVLHRYRNRTQFEHRIIFKSNPIISVDCTE